MCSVPLQLEKILDAVCQPMVGGDIWGETYGVGGGDTSLTEEEKTQGMVMEAERILSRPIHLGRTLGTKSNRTQVKRGKGGRDAEER